MNAPSVPEADEAFGLLVPELERGRPRPVGQDSVGTS